MMAGDDNASVTAQCALLGSCISGQIEHYLCAPPAHCYSICELLVQVVHTGNFEGKNLH